MAISAGQVIRFMTLRITEGLIVLLLIMFMPNIPPYCKIQDPIPVTSSMPLEGKLALNEKLNDAVVWHKGDLHGPEAFADYNGILYASLQSGEIVKFVDDQVTPVVKFGKPCKGFYQEKICGRPLGIQFDKDGSLIAADAYYGIFRVDVNTGNQIQLISPDVEIDGKKPKIPNSVAIASNGDIYWSDSSTEFYLEDGLIDMLADGSGRLIHYNTKTKQNTVLIDNLLFANGVALSDDEEFVIVSETGRSCVHRYYLKGPKQGTKDIFIDGLPGLPDNINSDGQGGFFFPLISSRDDYTPIPMQVLGTFPLFRKLIARLVGLSELGFSIGHQLYPNEYSERALHFIGHFSVMTFVIPRRVTILHVSKTGEVINSFHGNNKKIVGISEAHIFKDQLYLGSPFNDYIGRIPLSKLDLGHLEKKMEAEKKPEDIPTTKPPSTTTTPTKTTSTTTSVPTKTTTTTSVPTKTTTATTPVPTTKSQETTAKPTTTKEKTTKPPTTTNKPVTSQTQPQQKPETATPKPTETPKTLPKPSTPKPTQPTTSQPKPSPTSQQKQPPPSQNKIPK